VPVLTESSSDAKVYPPKMIFFFLQLFVSGVSAAQAAEAFEAAAKCFDVPVDRVPSRLKVWIPS
jgi:hypothetical protein